ncbi:hypothetical protein DUNSADRAFT_3348 [Dunaliella salina]|uniref:Assembly chaperone of rpl4 n=1 Tax=Dunaliella salina TaxID=3046 RepID=A0ABQ7GUC1_DUNSA|nr:hypothetical protein DUNSADRAFT_3348 [Dunaliella salina]|eukprot:KAF5838153.1 hypothetical protein DUNSADRAFT_3348 [Dunaliella salina]
MTKAGKKSGAGSKGKAAAGPRAPAQQVSAADLYMQAQIALQYDDIDGAKKALKLAVKLEPANAALLDAYACLLAEVEDPGALTALQQAVEASPQSGHEKYMYLAQLEEDCDKALSYSNLGLGLLHQRLHAAKTAAASGATTSTGPDDDDEVDEVAVLTQALSSALCTHAEMLVQKAAAERDFAAGASQQEEPVRGLDPSVIQQVEAMCAQSKELTARSPEPGQLLASLYSQAGRQEEALAALRASMELWFRHTPDSDEEQDQEGEAGEGGSAMEEDEEEEELPSQEFRVECVKLLLELDETTHAATEVLESLIEEDDSNPHFWHLLGLAFYSGHHYEEALEAVGKSGTLMQQLRIPRNDDIWAEMEDLSSAIREAMGVRAAEAGAAGQKS